MNSSLMYAGYLVFALPYLAIVAILLHNWLRRMWWKRGKDLRRPNPALCSTTAALGAMLLLWQTLYRPSVTHTIEARRRIDVDEDDSGDPEHPDHLLQRQLKRIRRGEPVDRLGVRM
jgi:hypothetical protein